MSDTHAVVRTDIIGIIQVLQKISTKIKRYQPLVDILFCWPVSFWTHWYLFKLVDIFYKLADIFCSQCVYQISEPQLLDNVNLAGPYLKLKLSNHWPISLDRYGTAKLIWSSNFGRYLLKSSTHFLKILATCTMHHLLKVFIKKHVNTHE